MKLKFVLLAGSAVSLASPLALADHKPGHKQDVQTDRGMTEDATPAGPRRVRITYENLTTGQVFSPSVFVTHDSGAPAFFKTGEKASFGLARIAEDGSVGPVLGADAAKKSGAEFGGSVIGLPTLPGATGSIEIEVTPEHPMISGAWMLGMTNDGFTGVNAVDAYALREAKTMTLMAFDAGTEKNNEKRSHLIPLMGTDRDPENGVIAAHAGLTGKADAPAEWNFDPKKPVARITIEPAAMMEQSGR